MKEEELEPISAPNVQIEHTLQDASVSKEGSRVLQVIMHFNAKIAPVNYNHIR
jgi:hypothetical protein